MTTLVLFAGLVQPLGAQTWQLIWSDEFDGAANSFPDSSKWTYDTGGGGWGNAELETYCAPGSNAAPCSSAFPNAFLDGNGNLVIRARKDPSGNWTSARLKTQGVFSFQYGRVEARMKLTAGNGLWPAFWMLGNNIDTVGWPSCGEDDIIEWVDSYGPGTTSSTSHGPGYSGGNGIGARYTFPSGGRIDDSDYHIYGLIWSPNLLQYYRDSPSNIFLTVTPSSIPSGDQWVYNAPFFILLNQAVGGNWFPGPDGTTPNPADMVVDYVRVYQPVAGPAAVPLRFVPIAPCRVADTRGATGAFGGPLLASKTSRDFAIPGSSCNVPGTAQSYSLNVTVVPSSTLSYVTVWPSGQTQPLVSTLNSPDGRIKANAAIVPAGSNGAVSVYASDDTQVILDIDGYFVPETDTSALAFYPLAPCRVADTRNDIGALGGPYITGQAPGRDLPILSSTCNVPSSAQAYSLNFTAVPRGQLIYLSTWPTGETQPTVSTLNAPTGAITANAAIVPAGTNGDITVYASNDTDLVIDINGYFAPATTGALSLYNLTPCRVLDTRGAPGGAPFTGTYTVPFTTSTVCTVPPTAQAYVLNVTVVPAGELIYLTLWPDAQAGPPNASTLNATDGMIASNMAIVPVTDGSIDAYASNPTQLIFDIFGYFAP